MNMLEPAEHVVIFLYATTAVVVVAYDAGIAGLSKTRKTVSESPCARHISVSLAKALLLHARAPCNGPRLPEGLATKLGNYSEIPGTLVQDTSPCQSETPDRDTSRPQPTIWTGVGVGTVGSPRANVLHSTTFPTTCNPQTLTSDTPRTQLVNPEHFKKPRCRQN